MRLPEARPLVATVGSRERTAGRWWSRTLDRPLVTLGHLGEVEHLRGAMSVALVIGEQDLTGALVDEIIACSRAARLSVGVLPADLDVARTMAAAAQEPRTGVAAFSHFVGDRRIALAEQAALYGAPGVEAFLDTVQAGVEAALLETHGNGFDMPLGRHVVCARLARRPAAGALACFAGGPCMRAREGDPEDRFVDPRRLRARALVIDTCLGIHLAGGVYRPGLGVADVVLGSGACAAVLAPVTIQSSSTARFGATVARYLCGESLGEIALALNEEAARAYGERPSWVLAGDPELRGRVRMALEDRPPAAGAAGCGLSAVRLPRRGVVPAAGDGAYGYVSRRAPGGVGRMLTHLRAKPVGGVGATVARAAARAALLLRAASAAGEAVADAGLIDELEAVARLHGDAATAALDRRVAVAVATLAAARPDGLRDFWSAWMRASASPRNGYCACGEQVGAVHLNDPLVRGGGRDLARCGACGTTFDRGSDGRFDPAGGAQAVLGATLVRCRELAFDVQIAA
jgi:hypothetical protein